MQRDKTTCFITTSISFTDLSRGILQFLLGALTIFLVMKRFSFGLGSSYHYNKDASWLKIVENILSSRKMVNVTISNEMFLKKMPNWKVPGLDGVHGYWLKHLSSIHLKLLEYFNDFITTRGKSLLNVHHC